MSELFHSMSKCEDSARRSPLANADEGTNFQFTLNIRVDAMKALRRAAAQHLLRQNSGDAAEDLDDLLGPLEDPSIEDCLLALLLPPALDGCSLMDISVKEVEAQS